MQSHRVEPFAEPAIDRSKQRTSFGTLAPLLPQPGQAHGGTEFERLRLLLTSHVEGLLQTLFGFVRLSTLLGWVALGCAQEQQLTPLAMQLRFIVPLPRLLHQGQRFV